MFNKSFSLQLYCLWDNVEKYHTALQVDCKIIKLMLQSVWPWPNLSSYINTCLQWLQKIWTTRDGGLPTIPRTKTKKLKVSKKSAKLYTMILYQVYYI